MVLARGWSCTNDHVDISLDHVNWYKVNTGNPEIENPIAKSNQEKNNIFIGDTRNQTSIPKTLDESDSSSIDFYTTYDPFLTSILDKEEYLKNIENLGEAELNILNADKNYYELQFSNLGGLVMPILLEFEFTNGIKEVLRIPAEIWKSNNEQVSKIFVFDEQLRRVTLDPFLETADVDRNNNYWPPKIEPTRFQLFKDRNRIQENPMQEARRLKKK